MYALRWIGVERGSGYFSLRVWDGKSMPPKRGESREVFECAGGCAAGGGGGIGGQGDCGGGTTWRCRRFWRRICQAYRCGIRITRWCMRRGWVGWRRWAMAASDGCAGRGCGDLCAEWCADGVYAVSVAGRLTMVRRVWLGAVLLGASAISMWGQETPSASAAPGAQTTPAEQTTAPDWQSYH